MYMDVKYGKYWQKPVIPQTMFQKYVIISCMIVSGFMECWLNQNLDITALFLQKEQIHDQSLQAIKNELDRIVRHILYKTSVSFFPGLSQDLGLAKFTRFFTGWINIENLHDFALLEVCSLFTLPEIIYQ